MKQGGDIALAILVLAIIAMLVVPLPTMAIDGLIVMNLSISVLLLLLGLYMPSSLSLLSFPTLLLLTTLFRLALNVASARLILSQADAGVVIHAFGTFLIRGELFVGIVIFTIVTLVNFLVIARGASRVSEVAARFVLDALPGKQSSIDSDLRSGLLTPESARQKRDELRKESQLFGAMDGAMKFVQGDAIAGIVIIFVNILGGLYMGLSQGMELANAAQTYTVLTVGDGLVSQIPALLISICAGVVVTRVSSNEGLTLGSDLSIQLFSNPTAIIFTGALLFLVALLPGIPFLPFAIVGAAFLGTGAYFMKYSLLSAAPNRLASDRLLSPSRSKDVTDSKMLLDVSSSLPSLEGGKTLQQTAERIHLELGNRAFQLYSFRGEQYYQWWETQHEQIFSELGISLPRLTISKSEACAPLEMIVRFDGIDLVRAQCQPDIVYVGIHPSHAAVLGLSVSAGACDPLFGSKITVTTSGPDTRRLVDALAVPMFDIFQYHLRAALNSLLLNPSAIVPFSFALQELRYFEQQTGGLKSDAISRYFVSPPKLYQILIELVRERISIRPGTGILELIAEFCVTNKISVVDDTDVAIGPVIDFIRQRRARHLDRKTRGFSNHVITFSLTSTMETFFLESPLDETNALISLPDPHRQRLVLALNDRLKVVRDRGAIRFVIMCSADVRYRVAVWLKMIDSFVETITISECDQKRPVISAGFIEPRGYRS